MNTDSRSRIVIDGEPSSSVRVTFPSRDADNPGEAAAVPGEEESREAIADLFLPEGEPANRAAVVVVHGLGGQKPERELTYGHKLASAGYVALVLDSFAARGVKDAIEPRRAIEVSTWSILADAYAGLRFLAGHPAVNPEAVAIIGFSWGGMVTLLSVYEQVRRTYLRQRPLRFAGHVSYYGCSVPRLEDPTTTGAPVLSLIGSKDENVSVERMREICEDMKRGGSPTELEVFDAYHQWDGKDLEPRHNAASLANLHMTLTRDNEMREERWNREVEGPLTQALVMLRDLDWHGYDMLRDEELHRRTDRLLFDFLDKVAAGAGAVRGDPSKVSYGAIGSEPTEA